MTSIKRLIAVLMIVQLMTGCTRAVQVHREQFVSASQDKKNAHRINMNDGSPAVTRFSLTDSTVAIAELHQADERYKHVDLPIVLPRKDVKSIEKLELDPGKSFFVVAPVGLVILLIVGIATMPPLMN